MSYLDLFYSGRLKEIAEGPVRGNESAALYDVCDGQEALLSAVTSEKIGKKALFVTSSPRRAERMAGEIAAWIGERCRCLPDREVLFVDGVGGTENAEQRLETLRALAENRVDVLVASAGSLMLPLGSMREFREKSIGVSRGMAMKREDLGEKLRRAGYERRSMVEGPMQYAMRGDIADIWPAGEKRALRVEFFGDEIDLVRLFDPLTQRSVENLEEEAKIYPARVFLWDRPDSARVKDMQRAVGDMIARQEAASLEAGGLRGESDRILETEASGQYPGDLMKWSGFLGLERTGVWSWFDQPPVVFLDDPEHVSEAWDDREAGFLADLKAAAERGDAVWEWKNALFGRDEVRASLDAFQTVTLQKFLRGQLSFHADRVMSWPGTNSVKYFSRLKDLADDIRTWRQEKTRFYLCAGGENRQQRLIHALSEFNIDVRVIPDDSASLPDEGILSCSLGQGFILTGDGLNVIADSDIFGASRQEKKKRNVRRDTASARIDAFTDLSEGDYVVHESHGVGIYKGTVRLQSEGSWRDYFLIQYRGSDRLYVPTDQFDRVQKFIGGGDEPPELNSLGDDRWLKQRKKVRAGLKELAFDLVKLYAERQEKPGYAFAPDTPWQAEFEDAFPHELTGDQLNAVEDIKRDMERPTNMDRLLCGDVGFGKTEVALRAVFKCVMSGKQAAILCPTTILAQQHYYTVQERFQAFAVRAEVLSRFRSAKDTRRILTELKEGRLDVVIGTHKLLSDKVVFKDLGLLVVDEEQRFGVSHKEKIKNFKKQVDVLTLSATPIPRTLHMSMIGVRDMSLLTSPPEERHPVQTYVTEYSDALVRDAVTREAGRGGQVYFLYNHVQHIDTFASHLRSILPDIRIAVAHGQMPGNLLEDVMLDFYDHKYDVLLSSTIIENGLDVANANTMIVYDADRYGLSQLYQLRGRVGRSNRTAFAYFTVKKDKMLSEVAEKRLNAIREFTAFGSGFRVAMRDLEIRGSGNIFGPEQSGNIAAVGYDLYCRMIEEAVREIKGGAGASAGVETRVELKVDAFLPQTYVRDERQRMEVFKRISLIRNREDREDVIEELIDRFGEIPESVMNLIDVAHLKAVSSALFVSRVTGTKGLLSFILEKCPDPERLYLALTRTDSRLMFSASSQAAILLRDNGKDVTEMMREAVRVVEKLADIMNFREEEEGEKKNA